MVSDEVQNTYILYQFVMKDTIPFGLKIVFVLLLFTQLGVAFETQLLQQKINWLNSRLSSRLTREDVPFKFMQTWAAKKGLYQSSVHINFLDKRNTWLTDKLRNSPIGDINMFVTSFVLYSQLQAQQLGTIKVNDRDFSLALESLSEFRDKNIEYGIPQYIFWPQSLVNGSWSAEPTNLVSLAKIWPSKRPKILNKFLQYSGLWMIQFVKDLTFYIPADNDDSGVNLALLGLMKETNSSHFEWWNNYNFNKIAYYKKVLKYAYRPFDANNSQNKFSNQIDPRTYYAIRQFIETRNQSSQQLNTSPSLILPTTWLLKQDEQILPLIQMPYMSNNVDATVCCNVLFGLFYQVLTDIFQLSDLPQLNYMIRDTVDFLVFAVQNKIEVRPDLILVYYPSKYDFYWFLARIVQLLKRYEQKIKILNIQPLLYAKEKLQQLMKNHGTNHITKNKKSLSKNSNASFWVQFLGNYAGKERNDDAIFNTVMALNALYDTWTVRNKSELLFDSETPQSVKNTINEGTNYLMLKIGDRMKEYNSFFSGSLKTLTTSPFNYPANLHEYKGKTIDPQTTKEADINYAMRFLVKGTIQSDQYENMCKLKWFQKPVPQKFQGYNQTPFPYWSSRAITQAMMISVLSKKMKAK